MAKIKRIYVEKKSEFAVAAEQLLFDLKENLGISGISGVRVLIRYDIAGISDVDYRKARRTIFSEPPVDHVSDEEVDIAAGDRVFAIEYLPGQYDQRADSAAQCIRILTHRDNALVSAATVLVLRGRISEDEFLKIKKYLINPVDSREASLTKPEKLKMKFKKPADVAILKSFILIPQEELEQLRQSLDLAMSPEDFRFCREYFKEEEKRDPTITEIKMLDTYWSDHCRHTTFETRLERVKIEGSPFTEPVEKAYRRYLSAYDLVYPGKERDVSLMKIATMSAKQLAKTKVVTDVEISTEINACSIIRQVKIDGREEEWLVMFKNETHNHPTEIEPFGGAATCLGGAIRDPLSGRAYVYQAMRVTGSGDPRKKIADTLPGKLPQRKITTEAAHGYSSYGNQIGVPTGQVVEIYHDGYVAKRMEVGAVVGAVPRKNVVREEPEPGDLILLVGGRTGRDGIGGATGSSKQHTEESISTAGAEVQKGNPPEERKLQRLFRDPRATRLIKKSNDFGAGGVSVAIGELAEGLVINLDRVPKKYEGLDGTELALSESQERMAVLLSAKDVEKFKKLADEENLEASEIASVTADKRLKMYWRGEKIIDISRRFINTNGVRQKQSLIVPTPNPEENFFKKRIKTTGNRSVDIKQDWLDTLSDLNAASQKGLVERFDSTVGGNTVLLPFGGKYQHTPVEAMAAKIPLLAEQEDAATGTVMSFGFNPQISTWSPFHSAVYAVIEAVAKIVAVGGDYRSIRTSLQEYFENVGTDKKKWCKPFAALLGAYDALTELGIPAIGGKDSMSGSFENLNVPPTLITFAVTTMDVNNTISPEFKQDGSPVYHFRLGRDVREMPDFDSLKRNYPRITEKIGTGQIISAAVVKAGGMAEAITRMCLGNRIGFTFAGEIPPEDLFSPDYGSLILEVDPEKFEQQADSDLTLLGSTRAEPVIRIGQVTISMAEVLSHWQEPLEKIFPTRTAESRAPIDVSIGASIRDKRSGKKPSLKIAKPRVLIPVFPGTNCEYETGKAFKKAGAVVDTLIFRNLTASHINESLERLREKIDNSQIVVIPGGFSAGDEPEGSGKFIAAVFRNPAVSESIMRLLRERDGLMLGICNGFQALIKLGLVPYGDIRTMDEESPTLTFNRIGRHVSCMVRTKVTSILSPWFLLARPGQAHTIAISHGEGRFVAPEAAIDELFKNSQVATQYVDLEGQPTYDIAFNPNGSMHAVEGITSPDGRVLGKMGHSERMGSNVAKNVPGEKDQRLFESGVKYFE